MATRPTVGGSDGTWGTELNDHLDISLDDDGKVDDGAAQTTSAAPTADAELANKKYVDDQIAAAVAGAGFWKTDGTQVFNTSMTAANTFQDLDLSAQVGSNNALVFIQITGTTGAIVLVKPKGEGGVYSKHDTADGGSCRVDLDSSGDFAYVVTTTDASGVIQIAAQDNSTTITMKLIGYIN